MFRALVVFIVLFLSAPAHAWSEADTRRQVGYFVLHAIDWGQTLDISANCRPTTTTVRKSHKVGPNGDPNTTRTNPPEVSELNPVLSDCPDRGEVNRYFLVTGLAHYAIARALPADYRKWWQRVTIAVEAGVVAHNFSIGVDVRF